MKLNRLLLMTVVLFLPITALRAEAEEEADKQQPKYEYGMRFSARTNVTLIPKKLKLGLCAELRTLDVITQFSMLRPEIRLTYIPSKYFNMYLVGDVIVKKKEITYRPEIALTGKYSFSGLTLSLRERFLGAFTPERKDPTRALAFLRTVPRVQYKFNNSRVSPYFYADIYLYFNGPVQGEISRVGYFLGTDIKLNPQNKLDLKLIYETFYKQYIPTKHYFAFGISYTFN